MTDSKMLYDLYVSTDHVPGKCRNDFTVVCLYTELILDKYLFNTGGI